MNRNAVIFSVCLALFGALILVLLLAAQMSDSSLVWSAYLLPIFIFALAAYIYVSERINAELVRAMQARDFGRDTEQQSQISESRSGLLPPPLTIEVFSTANPLPQGTGGSVHLARIEEGKNFWIQEVRSAVRALAWYGVVIAALAQFVPVQYPFSQIFWLAIIVTLVVTRKRASSASFLGRLSWPGLMYWFWICATVVLTAFYLVAGMRSLFDLHVALKCFGLALIGMIALISSRRRWRRMTLGKPELSRACRYNLLFLWVFKSRGSVWHLLSGIAQEWAALGGTRLLGGGEFLGTEPWRLIWHWLRGRAGQFVIKTPEDLDKRMKLMWARPTSRFETFVCTDAIWKMALDRLLSDSAIVLMNLSGLSDNNRGCLYEIELLFDRVALSRVVFLIDKTTDVGHVKKVMEDVWQRLNVDSVNRFGPVTVVWIVQVALSMAEVLAVNDPDAAAKRERADTRVTAHADELNRLVRFLCAALERSEIQSHDLYRKGPLV